MANIRNVLRDSDGTTVDLAKQEAEQADIPAKAKRVVIVGGSAGSDLTVDSITGALAVIQTEHYEVHQGHMFKVDTSDDDLDNTETLSVYLKTPDTTARIHMFYSVYSSGAATFELLEGPTVTSGTGSQLTIYNRERNSATASTVWDNTGTPVVNKASLNVTTTADGTQLHHEMLGSGKNKLAGDTRDANEWILKQNTKYVFRVTGDANDNRVNLILNFYEE
jgi:hypothetical protein